MEASIRSKTDTVAAIATPPGVGGISVIRISGPHAIEIADKGFRGNKKLTGVPTHTAHHGKFISPSDEALDEIVALVFREPHSYTGENVVELSCHGGVLVTKRLLQAVIEYGSCHAEPGEFTKRAFLNGKIDLSQAEAVADLIHASSDLALRNSLEQLDGAFSKQVKLLRNQLLDTLGLLELELDFVEEQIEFLDKDKTIQSIGNIQRELVALESTYKTGKIYREGVKVVFAGAPNVGKSSILNNLLNENRAIVTEIPGTTRDVIEESLNIGGLLFRVVDTAGLRETQDLIELEGIRRTETQINTCDLLVLVFDASRPLTQEEIEVTKKVVETKISVTNSVLVAINKIDLPPAIQGGPLQKTPFLQYSQPVCVSALYGTGMDQLKSKLVELSLSKSLDFSQAGTTVTNLRHLRAIQEAAKSTGLAKQSLENGNGNELIAIDLRAALDKLGEIIGAVTTDDILNNIFSKFCIGK